jgi:hypothetical protein
MWTDNGCTGNLFELLRLDSMRDMDWGTRLAIALDCVRGVACLHRMGMLVTNPVPIPTSHLPV